MEENATSSPICVADRQRRAITMPRGRRTELGVRRSRGRRRYRQGMAFVNCMPETADVKSHQFVNQTSQSGKGTKEGREDWIRQNLAEKLGVPGDPSLSLQHLVSTPRRKRAEKISSSMSMTISISILQGRRRIKCRIEIGSPAGRVTSD